MNLENRKKKRNKTTTKKKKDEIMQAFEKSQYNLKGHTILRKVQF